MASRQRLSWNPGLLLHQAPRRPALHGPRIFGAARLQKRRVGLRGSPGVSSGRHARTLARAAQHNKHGRAAPAGPSPRFSCTGMLQGIRARMRGTSLGGLVDR